MPLVVVTGAFDRKGHARGFGEGEGRLDFLDCLDFELQERLC